jgi:hypothetical protein
MTLVGNHKPFVPCWPVCQEDEIFMSCFDFFPKVIEGCLTFLLLLDPLLAPLSLAVVCDLLEEDPLSVEEKNVILE